MITYKLYEIKKLAYDKIGQLENIYKSAITECELDFVVEVPAEMLNNESYVSNIVNSRKVENNCVIVKFEDEKYKECVNVFFVHSQFLDCAEHSFRSICDYYFE